MPSTYLFEFAESSMWASLFVELTKSADLWLGHAYSYEVLIIDVFDLSDRCYLEAVVQLVVVGVQLGGEEELV